MFSQKKYLAKKEARAANITNIEILVASFSGAVWGITSIKPLFSSPQSSTPFSKASQRIAAAQTLLFVALVAYDYGQECAYREMRKTSSVR